MSERNEINVKNKLELIDRNEKKLIRLCAKAQRSIEFKSRAP